MKEFVRRDERLDMPDLINTLISADRTVAAYEHTGNWLDIGTPEDYARIGNQYCAGEMKTRAAISAASAT